MSCDKVRYASRDEAKAAKKRQPGRNIRAYRCAVCNGAWHLGHLPGIIIRGERTRGDLFGEAAPSD